MTEHPAFRRAMSDLGDEVSAPSTDLAGAARARARFVVRRRYAVATVAGAVFLGAIAAVALPGSDAPSRIVAADPTADPTPTTEPGESPSMSTSPSPTATAGPTAETPDPSGGVTPPRIAPSDDPAATGPTVTLRVVSGGKTGEETVVEAHVTDPGGSYAGMNFSFGVDDPAKVMEQRRTFPGGGAINYGPGELDVIDRSCGSDHSAPADRRMTLRHTFRVPGTYVAWVKVQTRSCDGTGEGRDDLGGAHVATATLRYTITGRLWPNGPRTPDVTTDNRRSHWEAPQGHMEDDGPGLEVEAIDDGVVVEIVVNWGDGTAPEKVPFKAHETAMGYNDCTYPDEFAMDTHHVVATPDHEYAQPGTYTATVTVTSASCDGTDRQTTTKTQALTWPPPAA